MREGGEIQGEMCQVVMMSHVKLQVRSDVSWVMFLMWSVKGRVLSIFPRVKPQVSYELSVKNDDVRC